MAAHHHRHCWRTVTQTPIGIGIAGRLHPRKPSPEKMSQRDTDARLLGNVPMDSNE
ncbi:hypothetical protein Rhe02_69450 [Rhizocola hellebori]|uniref:Uncharacterized protein n=1 Tax=Rhizocola hellebori TaxID=1392758 RepID=A0A8J3VKC0_9ACTN|nr:hypothetical protein Rhe02_69450 [Rhizocola hellebori]